MAKTQEYRIKFTQQGADKLRRDTQRLDEGFGKMESRLSKLGGLAAFAGVATGVTAFIGRATAAAAEQQEIFQRLQTAVEITGASYENLSPQINSTLAELQRFTKFGDTDSAQALTQLVQLTGDYSKAMKALPLTLDLAASGLFDQNTAARLMGQAMTGNVEVLGRYIPELKASNNELLKNATASKKAEIAFKTLTEKFGGTAVKNGQTAVSQWTRLMNELGDTVEKVGDKVLGAGSGGGKIIEFINAFNTAVDAGQLSAPSGFQRFFDDLLDVIDQTIQNAPGIGQLRESIEDATESFIEQQKAIQERLKAAADLKAALEIEAQKHAEATEQARRLAEQQERMARNMKNAVRSIREQTDTVITIDGDYEQLSRTVQSVERDNRKLADSWAQVARDLNIAHLGITDVNTQLNIMEFIGSDFAKDLQGHMAGLRSDFETIFVDIFDTGIVNIGKFGDAFVDMLKRIAAEQAAQFLSKLIGAGIGAVVGSAIPGIGTTVGAGVGASFGGGGNLTASGLGGGLAPALPPGGQTVIVHNHINTNDAKSFERYLREDGGGEAVATVLGELV